MIPIATLRLLCAATNRPKPLGFDVIVDRETIAVLKYEDLKEAVLKFEALQNPIHTETTNMPEIPTTTENNDALPGLPAESLDALQRLYSKFSDNPTDEQKLNILIGEVGVCNIDYEGMWKQSDEKQRHAKICVMEHDYLEKIGLYRPTTY